MFDDPIVFVVRCTRFLLLLD